MREFKTEGRESGESQVSVKARISIEWSDTNSLRRTGLFIESETEVAERAFRCTRLRLEETTTGPGLGSTSPESSKRNKRTRFLNLSGLRRTTMWCELRVKASDNLDRSEKREGLTVGNKTREEGVL